MLERDENGVLHVVGLSGGHDSTILSLELRDREPRPYNYLCTPTGDELPEMFEHWRKCGEMLGRRIIPIMAKTLRQVIAEQGALPNFRMRFCTRIIKIEPYAKFLAEQALIGPVVSYVGLRADEPERVGGLYGHIDGVKTRYPLREWGWTETEVQAGLAARGVLCPTRTDCARCYHQRLGEWYMLWTANRDIFLDAVADEQRTGNTFRSPGRDKWPVALADLAAEFERGNIPETSLNRMVREAQVGGCRACTL